MDSDPYTPPETETPDDRALAALESPGVPSAVVAMRVLYSLFGGVSIAIILYLGAGMKDLLLTLIVGGLLLVPPLLSVLHPRTPMAWWSGAIIGTLACVDAVLFFIGLFSDHNPVAAAAEGMSAAEDHPAAQMDNLLTFLPLVVVFLYVRLVWVSVQFIVSARSRCWHRVGKYRVARPVPGLSGADADAS